MSCLQAVVSCQSHIFVSHWFGTEGIQYTASDPEHPARCAPPTWKWSDGSKSCLHMLVNMEFVPYMVCRSLSCYRFGQINIIFCSLH